jgi:IS1 family transposase
LWSFVGAKIYVHWIWIAICKRTRQIVAYHIGGRDTETCKEFYQKIPIHYKQSFTYSDYYATYNKVIQTGKHQSIGKETGLTNHVERWNNTLRQHISRLVRKTLSFSKSDYYHEAHLRVFIHYYNNSLLPKSSSLFNAI